MGESAKKHTTRLKQDAVTEAINTEIVATRAFINHLQKSWYDALREDVKSENKWHGDVQRMSRATSAVTNPIAQKLLKADVESVRPEDRLARCVLEKATKIQYIIKTLPLEQARACIAGACAAELEIKKQGHRDRA